MEHCRSPCGQPPFFAARHEKIENGMRRSCAWSEVTMPVVRACDADIPIYRIYTSFIYIYTYMYLHYLYIVIGPSCVNFCFDSLNEFAYSYK